MWIDVERMGGSTLSAMAEAVENAAVVLICMSEKYKQSPNCRLGESLQLFTPRFKHLLYTCLSHVCLYIQWISSHGINLSYVTAD